MSEQIYKTQIIPALQTLYPFAIKLTRDPSDAEDLIQDTALKAWQAIESFDRSRQAKPWVRTIMINTFRTQVDRRARRLEVSRDDVDEPVVFEPEEMIDRTGRIASVREAIAKLPEHQRVAVVARMESDAYGPKVAEELGLTWGTFCSRINRGSKVIAEQVGAAA